MTATYTRCGPEVERIAYKLIHDHHRHLIDFGDIRIDYVFRSEAAKTAGKLVLGKARKIGGINAFLAAGDQAETGRPDDDTPSIEPFFVVELAADVWEILTPTQREALVDHELCHCVVDMNEKGDIVLGTRAHDVEAFVSEVERWGTWTPDIEALVKASQRSQLTLLEGGKTDHADDDEDQAAGE